MGYARLPKLPNPDKISFGNLKFVDYFAQVEPLDENEMNNYDQTTDVEFIKICWEAVLGKNGRIRYEAACSAIGDRLLVPKHEVALLLERYISRSDAKFIRLRIYLPHFTDPKTPGFVNFDVFGSRAAEILDDPKYVMMGMKTKHQREITEMKAKIETEEVRREFAEKQSEQEATA